MISPDPMSSICLGMYSGNFDICLFTFVMSLCHFREVEFTFCTYNLFIRHYQNRSLLLTFINAGQRQLCSRRGRKRDWTLEEAALVEGSSREPTTHHSRLWINSSRSGDLAMFTSKNRDFYWSSVLF